jgi:membrane-bound lytic murein transglycosylase B
VNKAAVLLGPLLAAAAAPISAAALLTAIAAPAVDHQLQTVACADPAQADPIAPTDPAAPTGSASSTAATPPPGVEEGGIGFPLPEPGSPRRASVGRRAAPIPTAVKVLYVAAGTRYGLPWPLLAGVGMAETNHGRATAPSSAGAEGLMQFLPSTWATMGVDGDGDHVANIRDNADSVFSAANYLATSGATKGQAGVRRAIFAYNHADSYVNDVLAWAQQYAANPGDLLVLADPVDCGPGTGDGNPGLPPLTNDRVATLLGWAQTQLGDPYVFAAAGPNAWDCSSFTRAAYARIGITLPRTAGTQRDWLAAGNGFRVPFGQERPGDLVFTDTYLGPSRIGHVMLVFDPATHTSIEAGGDHVGHYDYARYTSHAIFQIWRVGDVADPPSSNNSAKSANSAVGG